MKTTHARHHLRTPKLLPLAVFHAPPPGEDVDLFSDRDEDAAEYDAIVHEFEALHDADMAPPGQLWA